jgi:SAM-dependent methyltransferase
MAGCRSGSEGSPVGRDTTYDRFAWLYDRYWAGEFAARVLPVLDRLLLAPLPAGARLLDLCCGTGQLAHELTRRGFAVTGVDASEEMLRFARRNAPAAELLAGDARTLSLPAVYDGALCVFDSLNHATAPGELVTVFRNVHAALGQGRAFVFDLNMDEGDRARWRGSSGIVADDHVCVVRGRYRPEDAAGETDLTIFQREGEWRRDDIRLTHRCYSEEQVRTALAAAGFCRHGARRAARAGNAGRRRASVLSRNQARRKVKVRRDA